jgi:hypothetical protein
MSKLSLIVACAALALAPFSNTASADEGTPPPPPPARERGPRGAQFGPRAGAPAVQLTAEERTKIRAAVVKAKKTEKVAAAIKEAQEARTKWLAAVKATNAAIKEAVVADDPSLKDTVAKFGDAPLPGSQFGGPRDGARAGARPAGAGPRAHGNHAHGAKAKAKKADKPATDKPAE